MSRTAHHVPYKHRERSLAEWEKWVWLRHEPRWWRHEMKHVKRRAELGRALLSRDWDAQVFPLDSRPRLYYW